jgi:ankyrin repeat protein
MTALHYACASDRDDVEILEVLLGKGCADVNALNRAGESPLRLAINRKGAFSATARYLRDSGGKDLGPKPRLTSPVWRADPFALHEWTMSESPPKSRSVLLEKTFAERSRDLDLQEGTEIWESQQAAKGKFADLFGLDPDL